VPEQESATSLSERELQVLQMVATGASNQQIAQQLVISINTVKVHLRNIFEKLEVQSRTEASLRAIQLGWVSVSEESNSETGPSLAKTFLLSDPAPRPLQQWQQFYLMAVLLLTLITLVTPLFFRVSASGKPYLPLVIVANDQLYQKAASPTVSTSNNGGASRWRPLNAMTVSRAGLGVAVFEDKIYAIGGVKSSDKATRFVEIFDPGPNSWEDGSAKPTAVTNIGGAVIADKIYVPGGCTNDREAIDILEIYQPRTDTWTEGPPLPQPRCGYGLTAWGDRLYLFGGWNGQSFTDTIFVYTPETNEWDTLKIKLRTASGYMGVASFDETIFIVGGYDGQNALNQTYAFEPTTESWIEKAPMQERRGGLGLVSTATNLYAVGGGWNTSLQNSERYDPKSDSWSPFETPFTDRWRNLGLAVIGSEIFAVGGWDGTNGEYMADIISYNLVFQQFMPITRSDVNPTPEE